MLVCLSNQNRLAIYLYALFRIQNFTGKTDFGKFKNTQVKL